MGQKRTLPTCRQPIPDPRIASVLTDIGGTYEQILAEPNQPVCKDRKWQPALFHGIVVIPDEAAGRVPNRSVTCLAKLLKDKRRRSRTSLVSSEISAGQINLLVDANTLQSSGATKDGHRSGRHQYRARQGRPPPLRFWILPLRFMVGEWHVQHGRYSGGLVRTSVTSSVWTETQSSPALRKGLRNLSLRASSMSPGVTTEGSKGYLHKSFDPPKL